MAVSAELGMTVPVTLTEDELLQRIAGKIAEVVQQGQEPFYRLMYRLDIPEKKLNAVAGTDDVAMKVARLVYERQRAKVLTRMHFRQQADDSDPELRW
ncbi:hypothetical protein GCM10023093_14670 [Nemorincola caseinilytica]|uniref:Uncharacterized protein n=2 Tax=Nemorincola caseinilytica TaxID=2054315 RepID=A0ABP8NB64_9BACT